MIYLLSEKRLSPDKLKSLGCGCTNEMFYTQQGAKSHYDFTRMMFDFVQQHQTWAERKGNMHLYLLDSDVPLTFFLLSAGEVFNCIVRVSGIDFLTDEQKLMIYNTTKMKATIHDGVADVKEMRRYISNNASDDEKELHAAKGRLAHAKYLKRKANRDAILAPRYEAHNNAVQQLIDSFDWIIKPKMYALELD